jgi:hypothetical protein
VPHDGGPPETFVQGDGLLVRESACVQLAGVLRDQLASGAVDRWLAEHPDVGLTRAAVIAHIADLCDLPRMRAVRPGEGKETWIIQLVRGVCPTELAAVMGAFAGLESISAAPVRRSDVRALAAALEAQLEAGAVDTWLAENPNPRPAPRSVGPADIIANGRAAAAAYAAHLRQLADRSEKIRGSLARPEKPL